MLKKHTNIVSSLNIKVVSCLLFKGRVDLKIYNMHIHLKNVFFFQKFIREAMIPCILLALGGNLVDGKLIGAPEIQFFSCYYSPSCSCLVKKNLFLFLHFPGPGSSKLGIRTTAAIIFGRLILVPPAGLGIVTLADKLGFLPAGDKMFRFVLLLQHTMPTSILSGNNIFHTI